MARKRERIFAIVLTVLFLISSFGLSLFVVWQSRSGNNNSNATNATTNTTTPSANPLAGTKLAGFTPISSVSALKITDLKVGTGPAVKASNSITVDYTGAVAATGIIFQSTKDSGQSATFQLNQVIPGWVQGIPGMKVGGIRQLLIPAPLAYGATPPQGSNIPPNSALVFNVTLDKIN